MTQIRWGIIGCGDVTEVKSGPAFSRVKGSVLVAVMRRDGERAKDYARRHGVAKWTPDAQDLIHDPDVNAVYVATPPRFHAEYAVQAAEAGKPVYVEKPMALDYAECKKIIDVCTEEDVPLFVAYYRRRLPAFLKVKELVDSGSIGEVRLVGIRLYHPPNKDDLDRDNLPWRVLPDISGGGHFIDLGAHQFDFLDYLLGPIASVKGLAINQAGFYPAEDAVCANFIFESGCVGTGTWCFTVSENDTIDETEIVGSLGRIIYSTFGEEPVRLETDEGVQEFDLPNPQHVQQPLIQTVVDELQGRGKCPSTGMSAARTSRVMDEIIKDWRSSGFKT